MENNTRAVLDTEVADTAFGQLTKTAQFRSLHRDSFDTIVRTYLTAAESKELVLKNGPLALYLDKRIFAVNDNPIIITNKEYDLLVCYMRNVGRIMTHTEILLAVWGPAQRDERQYVRVFNSQLKTMFNETLPGVEVIRCVNGIGYVMDAIPHT